MQMYSGHSSPTELLQEPLLDEQLELVSRCGRQRTVELSMTEPMTPELQEAIRRLFSDIPQRTSGRLSRVLRLYDSSDQWYHIEIDLPSPASLSCRLSVTRMTPDQLLEERARQQETARDKFRSLTDREKDIVLMAAAGASKKVMAGCLKISSKTVEKHRGSAMRKLGLRCITELAGFGFQLFWNMTGWTEPAH
jgi:DNA-binding NarL/FixJ family response regulator